jgi:two-component system, OmpR family, sensor histidine kinase KdpD
MWQRVLRLGSKSIGAIVLSNGELNPATLDAIASLSAIALERARSFDAESRAEAARQSEDLRAAVLDALGPCIQDSTNHHSHGKFESSRERSSQRC